MVDQHSDAVEAKLVLEVLLRRLCRTAGTGNSILLTKSIRKILLTSIIVIRKKSIIASNLNELDSFVDSVLIEAN